MKVLLQRVSRASVSVDGETIGSIKSGLCLLVGFGTDDTEAKLQPMCEKLLNLRIFPDERGRFHHSVLDTKGGVLVVPQFTLYGDTDKGRRPGFSNSLAPELAEPLVEQFAEAIEAAGVAEVGRGKFGAHMAVELVNDGPVTFLIEV